MFSPLSMLFMRVCHRRRSSSSLQFRTRVHARTTSTDCKKPFQSTSIIINPGTVAQKFGEAQETICAWPWSPPGSDPSCRGIARLSLSFDKQDAIPSGASREESSQSRSPGKYSRNRPWSRSMSFQVVEPESVLAYRGSEQSIPAASDGHGCRQPPEQDFYSPTLAV